MPEAASAKPLAGLTVLDLTSALAGPFATLLLAGLGARVIKIERPGGDHVRNQPPYLGADGAKFVRDRPDDVSLGFIGRCRGKESVTLNLKHDEGKKTFFRLAEHADII